MFVVTRATLLNPAVLETRSLPRRFLGRAMPLPRRGGAGLWARLLFEAQFLRYVGALLPFVAPMLVWPSLAMPIAQAPLAMVVVLAAVEMKVLRLSDVRRATLIPADEAARRSDLFAWRARACLRRIAARQGLEEGRLHLVVEQSELARVPPLTLVSVQAAHPAPRLLDLDDADRAVLAGLFDADLTERDLHAVHLREGAFLREVPLEARSVSAHARLAAWIDREGARAAPAAEGA
ncbi:hypothetical protein [Roseivivax isoporae]|uniref:Uncharacterized protein n=1 Tax=Roseivivax isoporae LMG 25204 TaxID=1449351 RepID=X7FB93_9RHOB|nr:hypothetical protein [Roseivivax isoporae]ETX29369.1 hypothetical protein RISW2_01480 [Roseivivax isoporae LMG 25204]